VPPVDSIMRSMTSVRLTKIGRGSLGMTIPKKVLEHLRWWQGDNLIIEVGEDSFTVTNFNRHSIAPKLKRVEYGDHVSDRS
jgi:antitoxin component of MazEF toxin-antitoxin module